MIWESSFHCVTKPRITPKPDFLESWLMSNMDGRVQPGICIRFKSSLRLHAHCHGYADGPSRHEPDQDTFSNLYGSEIVHARRLWIHLTDWGYLNSWRVGIASEITLRLSIHPQSVSRLAVFVHLNNPIISLINIFGVLLSWGIYRKKRIETRGRNCCIYCFSHINYSLFSWMSSDHLSAKR